MARSIIDGQNATINNGVAYFDEPYFVSAVSLASKYRMRDFIIRPSEPERNEGGNMAYVIAIPITPEDTKELRRQFKKNNMFEKGYMIFRGIYEEEGVLYID